MAAQILIKRGLAANLAGITLGLGELAYTTDTKKLYVGDGAGSKIQIGADGDAVGSIIDELGTAATKDVGTESGNIPVLGEGGKLSEDILPAIAITDVFEATNEPTMLELNAQKGDVAIRSDLNKSFILKDSPATTLANWIELRTPTNAVLSVNDKTGAVILSAADVGLGNVDNTSDMDKPISTATQTALDFKAPLASPPLTGTPTAPTPATGDNSTKIATTAFVKAQNYIADGDTIDGGIF